MLMLIFSSLKILCMHSMMLRIRVLVLLSIGLFNPDPHPSGQFNVGIVYFKNDITGLGASDSGWSV